MTPNQLADELGIEGRPFGPGSGRPALDPPARRGPLGTSRRSRSARLGSVGAKGEQKPIRAKAAPQAATRKGPKDQNYVVDLCDEVLGEEALREHHFGWLRGDAGTTLPVDAYYPSARLVVEYRERQHDEPVARFDKPDQLTRIIRMSA